MVKLHYGISRQKRFFFELIFSIHIVQAVTDSRFPEGEGVNFKDGDAPPPPENCKIALKGKKQLC